MATFGRMRLDVENCLKELVDFGVARRLPDRPDAFRRRAARAAERRRPPRRVPRAARHDQHRGSVAVGAAVPRNDRPRREDADRLRVDPHRRQVGHLGAHPRPHRLGQGSGGAHDPRAERARPRELPGGELRRAAGHAVRVGNLRLREGRLHRRRRSQARARGARRPRHALPRRGRRPLARGPGQAAARARGSPVRAPRRAEVDRSGLPADLRDQPSARRVRPRQPLPRGPLLPRQRLLHPAALAARAPGGHPGARPTGSWPATARPTACRSTPRCSPTRPCRASSATTGRATSASWRARCRARRFPRRAA